LVKQRDELSGKVAELESLLDGKQTELDTLTEASDTFNSSKLDLVNQRDNLLERTVQLTAERDQFKCEIDKCNLKVAELEVDVNNYREEVNSLTQTVQMNFATVMERDSLKERAAEGSAVREALQQRVDELEADLRQKMAELEETKACYEQICSTRELEQQKAAELEEKIVVLESQVS